MALKVNPWKPMTDKTLKRIEDEAKKYVKDWRGFGIVEEAAKEAFLAGAKSERNKVLDEAIEITSSYRSLDRTQLKEILESLKL